MITKFRAGVMLVEGNCRGVECGDCPAQRGGGCGYTLSADSKLSSIARERIERYYRETVAVDVTQPEIRKRHRQISINITE